MLVQFQAARESCAALVARDARLPRPERHWLTMVDDVDADAAADVVQQAVDNLQQRGLGRPSSDIDIVEREALAALYTDVSRADSVSGAWAAVCTAVLSSNAFALY